MTHATSPADWHLLESVIHITEERDKKSLERVLVETLSDFIEFDAIILLRLSHSSGFLEEAYTLPKSACKDRFELVSQGVEANFIQQDESVARCIGNLEIISEELNGTTRSLFPIEINNQASGVLVIYGHRYTENSETLIRGFLRIHSNFLGILSDNERDTLTGLLNRKTFNANISELISAAMPESDTSSPQGTERRDASGDTSYWLGMLDIDHFKSINDSYGHVYGDEVLLLFSDLMKKIFRSSDLLFRYGGEEFVVVLSPATESDAYTVFERFRQSVELFDFPQVGRVTVSAGMVRISPQEYSLSVVERADQALYYAKQHGRNKICNYQRLVDAGVLKERRTDSDIELF